MKHKIEHRRKRSGIFQRGKVWWISYSSHMRMQGVDVLTVAEVLGHRDLRTTKIYQKADDKFKRAAVSKLDAAF